MAEEADKKSNKLTPDFVKHLMMQDFKGQQSLANKEYNFQLQFLEAFCDISNQFFFTDFQSMYKSQDVTNHDIKQMFQIYQENIRALITLRHAYVNENIARKMRKRDEDEFLKQLQEIKEEKIKARLEFNAHKKKLQQENAGLKTQLAQLKVELSECKAEFDRQLTRDMFGTGQQVTNAYIIKRS